MAETITAVATYSEIEEQSQIDELATILSEGYTAFTSLDGGVILLTKEPVEITNYESYDIFSLFRKHKKDIGSKHLFCIENNGNSINLEIFICKTS